MGECYIAAHAKSRGEVAVIYNLWRLVVQCLAAAGVPSHHHREEQFDTDGCGTLAHG